MHKKIKKLINIDKTHLSIILTFILFLVATLFLYKAFINATSPIIGSVDFPQFYDMSKDFWNKKDIFKIFREDDSYWFPMWNHLIYIIFYPYTLFELEVSKILWFCSNIIFTYLIIIMLKKIHALSLNKSLFLGILTVSSTPFTNTLGNGQLGLFLLLSLIFYWYSKSRIKNIFLSVAYIKFSFAPFFLLNSLFKKEVDLIYAMIISALAVIFYSFYVNEISLTQFINPLLVIYEVNKESVTNFVGVGYTFHIKTLLVALGLNKYYLISLIILTFLNLINIFFIKKSNNLLFIIIIISSLFIFYHNYYDFVFLIPLAAYLLKSKISKIIFIINFPIILWFFYFVRFNQLVMKNYFSSDLINFIGSILLVISYLSFTYNYFSNKRS
jgi:hypothetical protein|tara:strand:+ start:8092 stop:9246 length:1155 start_codon:yes stop_codon:yes gene_type:complete